MKTSLLRARPHLWYQLYWVVYLIWFFWLDLTVTDPNYIIHSPLDDFIPFNEWFLIPYLFWFVYPTAAGSFCWRASRHCSGGSTLPAMISSA